MKKVMLLIIFLLLTIPLSAQDELADLCFEKGAIWDAETSACQYYFGIEMNIHYPLEFIDYPNAQATLDSFFENSRDIFIALADPTYPSFVRVPYSLDMSYGLVKHSETIQSIVFTSYEYTGGAHGNSYFATFTFDLADDTLIPLEELFIDLESGLATIAPIVEAQVTAYYGDFADANWIEEGTAPIEGNYANFALSEDTLYFYFPPYQVAPYAAGTYTATLPLSDLTEVLNPEVVSLSGGE